MGLVKRLLDEPAGLKITFICPNEECEAEIEDHVEDTFFDWTADSMSDGISQATSHVTCQECDTEYKVEVVATGGEKQAKIEDHPDVPVDFADDTFEPYDLDYEDYLAQFEPTNPEEVFEKSLYDIDEILISTPQASLSRQAFLRMLYLQYVVALEAYLSDRMISIIISDEQKLVALVGSLPGLRDQETKFIEVAKKRSFAVDTTKAYLQAFSFHAIDKVEKMFKAVLGQSLFENGDIEKEVTTMINTRHDLVHRNGRNPAGKQTSLTEQDLKRAKELVRSVFTRVEKAYSDYIKNRKDLPF
ncbi:hypothetical protein G6K91_22280 [Agrobacterium rhizogenes]|nr:hypothetical protein [Rhizobium rhizogenes]NTG56199.1 hypothetical protein [Rhizobium rhizogenes]NTH01871.1 hypothetical protein [Rhizobium rhizogenes]NTH55338.1 hypothetical protein [Rhizobium rhizogenes]NTH74919.1 hypothetical protein [Rhizobium rhizogenes]